MAGPGDNAECKERWFMTMFGVDEVFTPDRPVASAKSAVVLNIAHIPLALTKVMEHNGALPDFAPTGGLSLKPWLGNNQGLELLPDIDLPLVEPMPPTTPRSRS